MRLFFVCFLPDFGLSFLCYSPSEMWSKIVRSAVFSRGLGDFAQRDELCEDCRSVRPDFVGVVLTRNGGKMGEFSPFYCRGGNAKGDGQMAGVSTTCRQSQHKRIQNAECRIKNARIVFTLAMATILRRRIA